MSGASWAGPLREYAFSTFTRVLAGPAASVALTDLGAEVLNIEPPETGDDTRLFPPFRDNVSHYPPTAPPVLGQHTDEISSDVLGLPSEQIERLRASKIVA